MKKKLYVPVASAIVVLGALFMVDSLTSWDSFAVVSAIAGWAVAITGVLHLFVALGRHGGEPARWLAVASGSVLVVLVVCGWVFASFGGDWSEITSVVLTVMATAFAMAGKARKG